MTICDMCRRDCNSNCIIPFCLTRSFEMNDICANCNNLIKLMNGMCATKCFEFSAYDPKR